MNKKNTDSNLTATTLKHTPIAIIGMASIFPQAQNLEEYWENIIREVDCIIDVPPSRWNVDDYYDPDPRARDKTYCKRGGFIPDVDFDPLEFGIPPNALEATDVSQLLSLVVARKAMADAGYDENKTFNRENAGVILGVAVGRQLGMPLGGRLQFPVWERVLKGYGLPDNDVAQIVEKLKSVYVEWQENSFPGMLGNVVAGRIANRLDLGGLNCVVDAACASSLGALKMAISELVERRSDLMITGGVDTDNSIMMYMCFSKTPAFSRQQNTKPFDAESDGMMVGEGIGMLVLKRLEDAERDNDRIYAVIRGIGTSSDGRHKSIYAPRSGGQVKALERAYEDAGISPETVELIEAHGTGTMAGDPAELAALNEVFGKNNGHTRHIALGSVKSQIGHTKAAAGAASLIKVALSLHHKVLPPTINVTQPVDELKDNTPFYINTKTRPWLSLQPQQPRRAGVSSFGFGGTNFHVVLEEYQPEQHQPYRLHALPASILLSAPTPAQLLAQCQKTLADLQRDETNATYLALVEMSQAKVVPSSEARVGFVAESPDQAGEALKKIIDNLTNTPHQESWNNPQGIYYRQSGLDAHQKIVALFSGQGSQYVEMGAALAMTLPPFREAYAHLDHLYAKDGRPSVSSVVFPYPSFDKVEKDNQAKALQRTEYAQPAIGAMSVGLYKTLQQAGFNPDFIAGHSFGELTALWAANALSDDDYFALVKARGTAMAAPNDPSFDAGSMLAIKGDIETLQSHIDTFPDLVIANYNSKSQAVVAGPTEAIERVQPLLTGKGFSVIKLPVSAAFHTPLVGHAQQPFAQALNTVQFHSPQTPTYANATGVRYPSEPTSIRDLLAGHILKPVLFKQQIENIYAEGGYCFVEFGPKNILTKLVDDTLADKPHLAIGLNPHSRQDSTRQLQSAVTQLRVIGLPLQSIDRYQMVRSTEEKKKSIVNVRLNGTNFISDKSKKAMELAIKKEDRVVSIKHESTPEKAPTPTPPPAPVSQENGHTPSRSVTTDRELIVAQPQQSTTIFEHSLDQFVRHQNDNARVHEQYLTHQSEYSKTFLQLIQQQYTVFSNGSVTSAEMDKIQTVLESLERGLDRFHDHQGETTRIHEQFLSGQVEFSKSFTEMVRYQYDFLNGDAGHLVTAKMPSNGVQTNGHPHPTPAPTLDSPPPPKEPEVENVAPSPTAPPVGPSSNVSIKIDVHHISSILLNVVSDKTGYPIEVLNLEMDMEADLGIDSIKRVEILGAMQEHFPNLPTVDPEALGELRTLGQIIDYAKVNLPVNGHGHAAASSPQTVEPARPDMASSTTKDASQPTAQKFNIEAILDILLNIVSDKTGYPIEVLDLEMDMEADLGIDSIKRVEILGAMQEHFPNLPTIDPEVLGELRTLGQIIDYTKVNISANGHSHPTVTEKVEPTPTQPLQNQESVQLSSTPVLIDQVEELPAINNQVSQSTVTHRDTGKISIKLYQVISDKTAYPIDILEPTMDIKTDLGIDQVKLVEILNAFQNTLLGLPKLTPDIVSDARTIGQLVEVIAKHFPDDKEAVTPDQPEAITGADFNIFRHEVSLERLPEPDYMEFNPPATTCCVITDDGGPTTTALAQSLLKQGWHPVVLSFPLTTIPEQLPLPENIERVVLEDLSEDHLQKQLKAIAKQHGSIGGFIHLNPSYPVGATIVEAFSEPQREIIRHVFFMAKHLKESLTDTTQPGRRFFLTVTRLDGQLGLSRKTSFGVIGGGLYGLTKALKREWPLVFCRALDLSPEADSAQAVAQILAELHDPIGEILEVGYDGQNRTTIIATPSPLVKTTASEARTVAESSVFLVSGGGKGITAHCAIKLAEQYRCKLILLGRSSIEEPEPAWANGCVEEAALKRLIVENLSVSGQKPSPHDIQALFNTIMSKREIAQTLKAIHEAGGQAIYLSADVTDKAALQEKLSQATQSLGPVTGLIHGAGNIADRWIEKKTERDFDLVYSTKIAGLENLLTCVSPGNLQHLVLFSSTSGFYGNIGQTDYALANEILNKTAHLMKQQYPNCRVVTINWGPWDGGMVTAALKRIFALQNAALIPLEVGSQMLIEEIELANPDTAQIVINSPNMPSMLPPDPQATPSDLQTFRIHRHITLVDNPFLIDHAIGNQPVLPFTCAASWMIEACEQLNPGYLFAGWTNIKTLKGIVLSEIAEGKLALDIKEISKENPGERELEATIWSQNEKGQLRYHYQGQIKLVRRIAVRPTYTAFDLTQKEAISGESLYQDRTLFHGPTFQGVEKVLNLSSSGLTMVCKLPAVPSEQQGQFLVHRFNPYITDVQLHSVLIWTQLVHQAGSLPSKLSRYEHFEVIPYNETFYISMEILSTSEQLIVFNIIAHDAQGNVYNRITSGEFTIGQQLKQMFKQVG
ncbi:MAG: SDR family NAD(P)-dependent oxidoreductase [Anaerolineae bacterium]|nr:SDR family NAD(P)-dependent oxidoreductase [Anaerolineae bacterium]